MATPSKKIRREESSETLSHVNNANDTNDNQNEKLSAFLVWCKTQKFNLNEKVTVGKKGSCAQYGMIAVQELEEAEVLFEVPRPALLHPQTTAISNILEQGKEELGSSSGWVPLLLALMFEYTNQTSQWRPYLDLCPDFDELDQPMFWTRDEVEQELQGTGISESVKRDEENICKEYQSIALPFMLKHKDTFNPDIHTLDLYKKMVAFVMAYSFTEPPSIVDDDDDDDSPPSPPMMVAMADILNHISKNNAKLRFGEDSLKMVTTRKIAKELLDRLKENTNEDEDKKGLEEIDVAVSEELDEDKRDYSTHDLCAEYDHPVYGCTGKCIETSKCPGSQYISNLCPNKPGDVRCCFSGHPDDNDEKCAASDGYCVATSQCPNGEYESYYCPTKPAGVKCCRSKRPNNCPSDGCGSTLKNKACSVQSNSNIRLISNNKVFNSKGDNDGADAQSNIADMCNGRKARRSSYDCTSNGATVPTPSGWVCIQAKVFDYLLALAEDYSFQVNTIAGACHSRTSRHYSGLAVDIQAGTSTESKAWKDKCNSMGGYGLGPGDAGHKTHGEEVFNTYGELANWQLLHMYGFAESYPNNTYDTVDIPMSVLRKCATSMDVCDVSLLEQRWEFLQDLDLVSDDGAFILGVNGVLTETELEMALKVICMSETEFQEYKDNEGWSSDDENGTENHLSNDSLHKLPSSWKQLLIKCVNECLTCYKETLAEDEAKLGSESLTKRQTFALHVRIGQKKLLCKFLELLGDKSGGR